MATVFGIASWSRVSPLSTNGRKAENAACKTLKSWPHYETRGRCEPARSSSFNTCGIMPKRHSAGILLYQRAPASSRAQWRVLLVRPGGPLWAGRDAHAFGVPKGLFTPGAEEPLAAARREFHEETGAEPPPADSLVRLGVFETGAKNVHVFVAEGTFDCDALVSNTFEMVWPRNGGTLQAFPEVDKAEWVDIDGIDAMLHKNQLAIGAAIRQYLGNLPRD